MPREDYLALPEKLRSVARELSYNESPQAVAKHLMFEAAAALEDILGKQWKIANRRIRDSSKTSSNNETNS